MNKSKISRDLYKKILENAPMCAVDFVLVYNNKVLLAYRTNEPAKDQWWLPGGRLYKNERLEDAIRRKAYEEVGIKVDIEKKIGCYEVMFKESPFKNIKSGLHYIAICYLVKPLNDNVEIKLDSQHLKHKWIDKIERTLHPYVKTVLKDSGIF